MNVNNYKMNRLNYLLRGFTLSLVMVSLITFSNCDDDEGEPVATDSLYELLSADPNLSIMKDFVDESPTLLGYLQGESEYTFFAPDNGAFLTLAATLTNQDESDINEEELAVILNAVRTDVIGEALLFHFASGDYSSSELAGETIDTQSSDDMTINADGTILNGGTQTAVEITDADNAATNGRLHVTEYVLIPPTLFVFIGNHLGKLTQPILLLEAYTILADGLALAEEFAATAQLPSIIDNYLTATTPFTMLAPTNDTFAAAEITEASQVGDGQTWYGIILNHISIGALGSGDFGHGSSIPTLLSFDGGSTFNNLLVIVGDPNVGTGVYFDSDGNFDPGNPDPTALNAELVIPDFFVPDIGAFHLIGGVLAPPVPQ